MIKISSVNYYCFFGLVEIREGNKSKMWIAMQIKIPAKRIVRSIFTRQHKMVQGCGSQTLNEHQRHRNVTEIIQRNGKHLMMSKWLWIFQISDWKHYLVWNIPDSFVLIRAYFSVIASQPHRESAKVSYFHAVTRHVNGSSLNKQANGLQIPRKTNFTKWFKCLSGRPHTES